MVVPPDPLTLIYRGAVALRNFLYDKEILPVRGVEVPVISVGNLSVGGSGKTSLVRFLAQEVGEKRRVAVVMRGYKRKTKGTLVVSDGREVLADVSEAGDEAYMLSKLCRNSVVVVSENRYKGALEAVKLGAEVIILDDGFQHMSLRRDLDVVCIRRSDLGDRLLPFGRLREPLGSIKRADAVVLSYQDLEPFEFNFGGIPVFRMVRRFGRVLRPDFSPLPVEDVKDKEFVAFAGLGDNEQFFRVLENLGLRVIERISFRDHHHYRDFKPRTDLFYLTTVKDLVKLPPADNIFALDFDLEVPGFAEFLKDKLHL